MGMREVQLDVEAATPLACVLSPSSLAVLSALEPRPKSDRVARSTRRPKLARSLSASLRPAQVREQAVLSVAALLCRLQFSRQYYQVVEDMLLALSVDSSEAVSLAVNESLLPVLQVRERIWKRRRS